MTANKLYYTFLKTRFFSLKKSWNIIAVEFSYYLTLLFHQVIHWGYPTGISIEPANICNLRCPECAVGRKELTRDKGLIELSLFKKIIDSVYHKTFYLTLYFQGEPFIHEQFFEMVKYAATKKMMVSTSTNAHFLTPENAIKTVKSGLSRIIISIDGITQEVYEKYRVGGSLDQVIEGTKNLIQARKELNSHHPEIIFQFLVTRQNEHQVEDMKNLAKNIGVDRMLFKTAQLYDFENGNELIPLNEKYSRYKKRQDGKFAIKNKLRNHCRRLWRSCVFTHDGVLLPCCFDKDGLHEMGDIKTQSFDEIWDGEEMKRFRIKLINARKSIDICNNCIEGSRIWI